MDYYSYSPHYRPKHIFKYPKFFLLIITIITAYVIFSGKSSPQFNGFITSLGFVGVFIAGMMYSYGFTAAMGTALLLLLGQNNNIFLAAIIGGLGSMTMDFLLFIFLRTSFNDEIDRLSNEHWVVYIHHLMPKWLKKILIPTIAGIIIAGPLPDELGVALMAVHRKIPKKVFAAVAFTLNTLGILTVLWLGKII